MSNIKEIKRIDINNLVPASFNPNKMPKDNFNKLSERIKEQGFKDPISVVPLDNGKYRIIEGEHRWKAARYLDYKEVPCFIQDGWDEDKQRFEIVKSNVLRGKIDVVEFTKLVNSLHKKYNNDVIREMMGFQDEKEFENFYKDVKKSLPPEMRDELEKAKDEIKTIDDLSIVLNRLFNEYGETLESGFMIIDYGGKDSIWIRADKELWNAAKLLADNVYKNKQNLSQVMRELITTNKTYKDFESEHKEEEKSNV